MKMPLVIAPAVSGRVFHMSNRFVPEYRFEFHENSRRVFYIRIGVEPEHGEILVEQAPDEERARICGMIWCRGYLEARKGNLVLHAH